MKADTNKSTSLNTSIINSLKDQVLLTDETLIAINSIREGDFFLW